MVTKTPDPIGQQARWLEQTEEYDFIIEHIPGVRHGNADAVASTNGAGSAISHGFKNGLVEVLL